MREGECDVSPSLLRSMVLLWAHTAPSPITHAHTHAPLSLLAHSCPVSSSLKAASSSLALLGGQDTVSAHWTATLFSGALSPAEEPGAFTACRMTFAGECAMWKRVANACTQIRPTLSVAAEKGAPGPSVESVPFAARHLGDKVSLYPGQYKTSSHLIYSRQPLRGGGSEGLRLSNSILRV